MRAVHLCPPPLVSPFGLLSTDQKMGQTLRRASEPPRTLTCPGGKTSGKPTMRVEKGGDPGQLSELSCGRKLEVLTHLVKEPTERTGPMKQDFKGGLKSAEIMGSMECRAGRELRGRKGSPGRGKGLC